MNKNDNNNENNLVNLKIDFENMEIGETYAVKLVSGVVVSGILVSRFETLTKDGVVKSYRIAFNHSKFIDLEEDEIDFISTLDELNEYYSDKTEYFKNFEKKYNIICFDRDGKLLPNATILSDVIDKKLWDELLEKEKREFLLQLEINIKDIVEIINVYVDCLREEAKLHEDMLRVSEEKEQLLEKFKKIDKLYPNLDKIDDLFYKDLGISNLINLTI